MIAVLLVVAVAVMVLGCRQSYLLGVLAGRRAAERDLAETLQVEKVETGWTLDLRDGPTPRRTAIEVAELLNRPR